MKYNLYIEIENNLKVSTLNLIWREKKEIIIFKFSDFIGITLKTADKKRAVMADDSCKPGCLDFC